MSRRMEKGYIALLLLTTVGVACSIEDQLGRIVEGQYIVSLQSGTSMNSVLHHIEQNLVSNGEHFRVFRRYRSALNGFAAEMSISTAHLISQLPDVKYVEEDVYGTVADTPTSWGLDRIDQRDLPLDANFDVQGEGEGVTVYVVDTGIRVSHVEFDGRAVLGRDCMGDGWNGTDCHGHGTHCAGTAAGGIHGIARKANIVSVRIFNCFGVGPVSVAVAGIDYVVENANHPAVMSMSFRFPAVRALDEAVARAVDSDIVSVVAAGNEDMDACRFSPPREPKAITVGASDQRDKRASFSNYGTCLDIFAPGVDIVSSSSASDEALAVWRGTSMATPHVAGVAAVHLGNGVPPSDVTERILQDASRNKIDDNQFLSPNKLLYI